MNELLNGFLQFAIFAAVLLGLVGLICYLCMTYDEKQAKIAQAERAKARARTHAREQAERDLPVSGLALSNALVQIGTDDQDKKKELSQLLNKPMRNG